MAAQFDYPPRGNYSLVSTSSSVNVIDTLYVQYDSPWSSINITMGCHDDNYEYNLVWIAPQNPLDGTGTFEIGSIDNLNFSDPLTTFPTLCNLRITDSEDINGDTLGQDFVVVSSEGVEATTYSATPTTSSAQSTGSKEPVSTSINATASSLASSSTPTGTRQSSEHVKSSHTTLSTGTVAGIAVGFAILLIIVAIFLYQLWRHRKEKLRRRQYSSKSEREMLYVETKSELPNSDTGIISSELSNNTKVYEAPDTLNHRSFRREYIMDIPQELE